MSDERAITKIRRRLGEIEAKLGRQGMSREHWERIHKIEARLDKLDPPSTPHDSETPSSSGLTYCPDCGDPLLACGCEPSQRPPGDEGEAKPVAWRVTSDRSRALYWDHRRAVREACSLDLEGDSRVSPLYSQATIDRLTAERDEWRRDWHRETDRTGPMYDRIQELEEKLEAMDARKPAAHHRISLAESYAILSELFHRVGEAHLEMSRSGLHVTGNHLDDRVRSLVEIARTARPEMTAEPIGELRIYSGEEWSFDVRPHPDLDIDRMGLTDMPGGRHPLYLAPHMAPGGRETEHNDRTPLTPLGCLHRIAQGVEDPQAAARTTLAHMGEEVPESEPGPAPEREHKYAAPHLTNWQALALKAANLATSDGDDRAFGERMLALMSEVEKAKPPERESVDPWEDIDRLIEEYGHARVCLAVAARVLPDGATADDMDADPTVQARRRDVSRAADRLRTRLQAHPTHTDPGTSRHAPRRKPPKAVHTDPAARTALRKVLGALEELERDADREDPDDPGAKGVRYAVAVVRRAIGIQITDPSEEAPDAD